MLALQLIKITWYKNMRYPKAAEERRKIISPKKLACSSYEGEGIFVNRNICYQTAEGCIDSAEFSKQFYKENYRNERLHKAMLNIGQTEKEYSGIFVLNTDCIPQLSSISVTQENECYKIMWHHDISDYGNLPVRRGHNEAFTDPDSPFTGNTILNETAFRLNHGEYGKMLYNYRNNSGDVPYYELYCIYFANVSKLTANTFTSADYKYEYRQLARLF